MGHVVEWSRAREKVKLTEDRPKNAAPDTIRLWIKAAARVKLPRGASQFTGIRI